MHKPTFYDSQRPRIWLRRCKDEETKCAIREYIINRGSKAEAISLANLEALYSGKPVLVE